MAARQENRLDRALPSAARAARILGMITALQAAFPMHPIGLFRVYARAIVGRHFVIADPETRFHTGVGSAVQTSSNLAERGPQSGPYGTPSAGWERMNSQLIVRVLAVMNGVIGPGLLGYEAEIRPFPPDFRPNSTYKPTDTLSSGLDLSHLSLIESRLISAGQSAELRHQTAIMEGQCPMHASLKIDRVHLRPAGGGGGLGMALRVLLVGSDPTDGILDGPWLPRPRVWAGDVPPVGSNPRTGDFRLARSRRGLHPDSVAGGARQRGA